VSIYNFNSVFHQVDLSLLRHFYAIATFKGFSKASRATGVSQPALSLGLQKLEKSLGVALIERSARPFELSRAGLTLLTFCERFQGNFESVMSSLGASTLSIQRRIKIGTALSVGFGPLEELCGKIESQKEVFELELLEQNTYQLLTDVHEGRLDAAFVPNDVFDSRLVFVPVSRDQILFVVGDKFRGAFKQGAWKQVASTIPLITFPRETPMRTLTDKICISEKIDFRTIYAVNSIEALKLLVGKNRGGAFALRSLVVSELKTKRLFEVELPVKLPRSGIALALSHEASRTTAAKQLTKILGVR
jgi:DNA-binding transcriptional LysR family regulator